jgi:hypothetical protein
MRSLQDIIVLLQQLIRDGRCGTKGSSDLRRRSVWCEIDVWFVGWLSGLELGISCRTVETGAPPNLVQKSEGDLFKTCFRIPGSQHRLCPCSVGNALG